MGWSMDTFLKFFQTSTQVSCSTVLPDHRIIELLQIKSKEFINLSRSSINISWFGFPMARENYTVKQTYLTNQAVFFLQQEPSTIHTRKFNLPNTSCHRCNGYTKTHEYLFCLCLFAITICNNSIWPFNFTLLHL